MISLLRCKALQIVHGSLQQCLDQRVTIGEVTVEGALTHTGQLGDQVKCDVDAMHCHCGLRRRQQLRTIVDRIFSLNLHAINIAYFRTICIQLKWTIVSV